MALERTRPSPFTAVSFPQVLGQVVQHHRTRAQRTQVAVAADLVLSQGAYSRLESGGSVFNVVQLRSVARSLGVTATGLLQAAEAVADRLEARGVKVLDSAPKPGMWLMLARESIAAVVHEVPTASAAKAKQYVQTEVKSKAAHVSVGVRNY